ncbi:hypothetical protein TW65_08265 [Stemphylium lycopersici]|nr:hypothetical protein TW65_08265 [Stemphylium lycopersici]
MSKLPVVSRPGDKCTQCQSCRTKSRIEKMNQLEIPETPDSVIPSTAPAQTSSAEAANSVHSAVVLNSVEKPRPVSWFHPSRTTLKPVIKKVGDETSRTFTPSRDKLLEPTDTTEAMSATDKLEQKVVIQPPHLKETSTHLDCDLFKLLHDEIQTDTGNQPPLPTPNRKQVVDSPVSASSTLHEKEDVPTTISPRQWYNERDDATTMLTTPSKRPESEQVRLENPSEVDPVPLPRVSGCLNVEDPTSSLREKHYTNRELARIALACAKGSRMTALQIIDWVALTFPYLQKGQGAWEKSLKAVLSISKEFSGKTVGLHEARVMYGFASAAFRAQYEKEYGDYITRQSQQESPQDQHKDVARPASVVDSGWDLKRHVEGTRKLHREVTPGKAIKSVPIQCAKSSSRKELKSSPSSRNFAATPTASDPNTVASPASMNSNDGSLFNPFERSKLPFVRDTTNRTHETKREASIHGVYPRGMKPSIETMTQKEKVAKLAEIRARTSRKQVFDSNQRLAHVRRYGRQDIHDESDGAWRPKIVEGEQKRSTWRNDTITDDCDANQSLHEVFNLPANAIPMNDGNELAFRDGTLVHGRLPRPRHIYRVGKRLGTGLTVN